MGGLSSFLGSATGSLGIGIGEKLFDNYASAKAATKAFDRQKWLAGHQYQLAVEDMKAAGLNPMLAVSGGGIHTGGAGVQKADVSKGTVSAGVASAVALNEALAEKARADARKTESETIDNARAPGLPNWVTEKLRTEIANLDEQRHLIRDERLYKQMQTEVEKLNRDQLRETLASLIQIVKQEAESGRLLLEGTRNQNAFEQSALGKLIRYINAILDPAATVTGAASRAVGAKAAYDIVKSRPTFKPGRR